MIDVDKLKSDVVREFGPGLEFKDYTFVHCGTTYYTLDIIGRGKNGVKFAASVDKKLLNDLGQEAAKAELFHVIRCYTKAAKEKANDGRTQD
jgi:hypothetical protein